MFALGIRSVACFLKEWIWTWDIFFPFDGGGFFRRNTWMSDGMHISVAIYFGILWHTSVYPSWSDIFRSWMSGTLRLNIHNPTSAAMRTKIADFKGNLRELRLRVVTIANAKILEDLVRRNPFLNKAVVSEQKPHSPRELQKISWSSSLIIGKSSVVQERSLYLRTNQVRPRESDISDISVPYRNRELVRTFFISEIAAQYVMQIYFYTRNIECHCQSCLGCNNQWYVPEKIVPCTISDGWK